MAEQANDKQHAERLTGLELERAMMLNMAAGTLGAMCFMLLAGIYLTSFANDLGLTDFQLGLMSAVPMLVFPARLYASLIVERLGHRKTFFIWSFAAARAVWILVIALPFVISPDHAWLRTGLFLLLLLVSNGLTAMAAPVWFSYMGDLVPEHRRGQFWAWRNAMAGAVPCLPIIGISILFDHLKSLGYQWSPYVLVFGFAVLVGEIDLWIHNKIPDLRMKRAAGKPRLLRLLLPPLRDRNFRGFLYYVAASTFSVMFLGHFTFRYLMKVLDGHTFPFSLGLATLHLEARAFVSLVSTLTVFLSLLLSPTWGYLIDRFGSKPALRLLTLLLVPMPLAWLFITPEHPYLVTVPLFVVAGVIYGARMTMAMNLIYATSPRENRTMYVALHGVVFGLFGAVAPITAGGLMHWLTDFVTYVGPLRIESFHVLCFVAVAVRVLEQYLLGGFREPKSKSAFTLVRQLARANPFAVLPRAFAVMSSVHPQRKASAARKLGHSRSQLATRDLIALLEDPNPHVREEAAMALGRTGDAEAVEPLVERLSDLDAEMRRQAAWALGQIGSGHAAERLIALLDDPYPNVRSAAAIALGQLGDGDAAQALLEFFEQANEPLEVASAATALGLLGCADALEPILDRLQQSDQHVFRRQLAVAVGDLLGPAHAFYGILDQELKVHGQRATRSIRRVRRAVRRTAVDGKLPRELRKHLRAIEPAYLASEWPECARELAAAREHLAPDPEACQIPYELLAWLGRRADDAGFETCLLGIYSLEVIAQQTQTPSDA